ncbi:MAG: hypothetical protein HYV63_07655 [Candidatus Schekmanbacteria bacterium]|nr:hypothetical protein [Candidatus Schekmanbacteria bacterium]
MKHVRWPNHALAPALALTGVVAACAWVLPYTDEERRLLGELEQAIRGVDKEVAEAQAEGATSGELAQSLAEVRVAYLRSTAAMLRFRRAAVQTRQADACAGEGPALAAAEPNPEQARALEAVLAEQRAVLASVRSELDRYESGLVKALLAARAGMVSNTIAMLEQRLLAARFGIPYLAVVAPGATPREQQPAQVAAIEADLAAQRAALAAARAEDERYSGGLVKALLSTRVATLANTVAMLEQRLLADRYGIPHLTAPAPASPRSADPSATLSGAATPNAASAVAAPAAAETPPAPADCPLEITRFDTTTQEDKYDRKHAVLLLVLRNSSSSRIKAWKLTARLKNVFGDELFTTRLTDGTADLGAGATGRAPFDFEDNQFDDSDQYSRLTAYSVENLRIEILDCQVSFAEAASTATPDPHEIAQRMGDVMALHGFPTPEPAAEERVQQIISDAMSRAGEPTATPPRTEGKAAPAATPRPVMRALLTDGKLVDGFLIEERVAEVVLEVGGRARVIPRGEIRTLHAVPAGSR